MTALLEKDQNDTLPELKLTTIEYTDPENMCIDSMDRIVRAVLSRCYLAAIYWQMANGTELLTLKNTTIEFVDPKNL